MLKKILPLTLLFTLIPVGAFAYDFWGITMGTTIYQGAPQLTFSGVAASGVQYAVGSYSWTLVDSTWYGPHAAASPGLGYNGIHRNFDAMGLFFKPQADVAKFMIITGMPQTGVDAAIAGYGNRKFGPGDLKLDIAGKTYGVGFRLSNLLWAVDPNTTSPYFKIYKAEGGVDSIYARDVGTLGRVELNPRWARVDHHSMPAYDPRGYAFFVSGTGSLVGSASVSHADTGLTLGTGRVYAYEASVPWSAIGIHSGAFQITASWRPDCGNDMIVGNFCGNRPVIPEPMSILLAISGFSTLAVARRWNRQR
jgi:hypothetical protein